MKKDENSFLSQFEKKGYEKPSEPKEASPQKPAEPALPQSEKAQARPAATDAPKPAPQRKRVDSQAQKETRQRNNRISAPEHTIETDTGFHKRKMAKMGIIGGSIIVVAGIIFFAVMMLTRIEVPDFEGQERSTATQWALTNRIGTTESEEYSLEIDSGRIISQSIEPGTMIRGGANIHLVISQGADQNEQIVLPDFENMTGAEIRQWRLDNAANNINVREEFSDTVENGGFISREFANANVTDDNFRRRDGMTILISRGVETFRMPNFATSDREAVEKWADDNELNINLLFESSSEVDAGDVISQTPEARAEFQRGESITVVISAGLGVVVPNFNTMTHAEAAEWATLNQVPLQQRNRLHAQVDFGRVISQSEVAGHELIADANGELPSLEVVYSLGRPYLLSLVGQNESVIAETFFTEFQSRGANITYTIRYVDSYETKGEIVRMSHWNQWLDMTVHVTFDVSRGNLTPPTPPEPSFPPPGGDVPDDGAGDGLE